MKRVFFQLPSSDARLRPDVRALETLDIGMPFIILHYYLFKKFLVSDWLTANCEIVISTQWLTKYGFFTFILAK
jgi:hypothetical protein